ncbi:hypothetical protein JBL43_15730 [Aureibaculum sp. A20]|uniref:PH domain-containing protein n=1 Tax=Aureibaculum flavum TaxID=2795986 RepID=A0ABS0WUT9_9FLAO|nr:hypothetical protein [Aureibaculum flavum]MBJ2175703.1 hypothetical protein [Aureibaculum flavum]
MTKTYCKKENVILWYFLLALGIGIMLFGWFLVKYFAWQAFLIFGVAIPKIISISKNPITPVIELNDKGLKLLTIAEQPFYEFSNIASIQMDSRSFNGKIKLKDAKKKIVIDSVAISLQDQQEIVAFVNQRIQ